MKPIAQRRSSVSSVLLIIGLLGLVLTSVFLSRRSVDHMQETSTSIYADRLVPTGILVKLTSAVYDKRLLLETQLLAPPSLANPTRTASQLEQHNRRIESFMTDFEQTKLTPDEANGLQRLTRQLTTYNQLEHSLVAASATPASVRLAQFVGEGATQFSQITRTLDELTTLQLTVGDELIHETKSNANYVYVLTALQIGLVLMVGLSLVWHRF